MNVYVVQSFRYDHFAVREVLKQLIITSWNFHSKIPILNLHGAKVEDCAFSAINYI